MSYDLEYGEFRDKPLAYLRTNDPDWSDARYMVKRWPNRFDFVNSTSFDESQHCGGPEDKANYEYWKETYAKTEQKTWWDLGSGAGIFVDIFLLTKDERESYEYLIEAGYELDEDATQKIKNEMEMESWDDYGRDDYKKALLSEIEAETGEEEKETVESLLDAIPDAAFDAAAFDMWSRASVYTETSGWEVTFPDPKNIFQYDDNLTDYTLGGVIDWLGIGHEITVRLSPQAFCRFHPGDKDIGYSGATYRRYEDEWILNITLDDILKSINYTHIPGWGELDYAAKFKKLLDAHMDESETYEGVDNAPVAKMMFDQNICRSPLLICDIDYIEEAKLKILHGPGVEWDDDLAKKEGEAAAQKKMDEDTEAYFRHGEMVKKVRNIAIDGAVEICGIDPAPDLVEYVVEQLILDAPNRPAATLDFPSTREHLKKVACEITKRTLDNRPPICNLRQLRLPHVAAEKRRGKRRKRA